MSGPIVAICAVATGCWLGASGSYAAQNEPPANITWLRGPATASLKGMAEIVVPKDYKFADAQTTQRLLKAAGEPTSGQETGMLVPEEGDWTLFFEFSEAGYVKDDDKDKLDADKLLKAIIRGNDYANTKRREMGNAPLNIIGWEKPPSYDPASHNLEWAIRGESQGRPILNYNIRLLGRRGVMEVVLVCAPDKLAGTLPAMKELLTGYSYKSGQKYAEYRPGDKVAQYGLAALITGGAVAVAAKTGLLATLFLVFKKAWKLVVIGVVAVVAFFKRIIFGPSARKME